jgi:hypothetical protein
MKNTKSSRPFGAWVLMILHFLIGVGALISGAMLFLSPDGNLMKMPLDVLKGSPFSNFLISGIILFIFVRIIPVGVAYGLLKRSVWQGLDILNPFKRFYWAWTASWAAGLIILIWVITETLLLGYISPLQPFIMLYGLVLILLTLLPGVRRWNLKQRD